VLNIESLDWSEKSKVMGVWVNLKLALVLCMNKFSALYLEN